MSDYLTVEYLENTIRNLDKIELPKNIYKIRGLTGYKIQRLLNSLCSHLEAKHLHIGLFAGATLAGACYNNTIPIYAVDNFSDRAKQKEFDKNMSDNNIDNYRLLVKNCWEVSSADLDNHKFNVYFFDGPHSEEDHANALVKYEQHLADRFVFLVDDFNGQNVQNGTKKGLDKIDAKILYHVHLKDGGHNDRNGYWNGLGVYLMENKNEI